MTPPLGPSEVAQMVGSAAEALAALGAAAAFAAGVRQYRKSEQWKQAEFVAKLVADFEASPKTGVAFTALDWSARRIDLFPELERPAEEWERVTDDLLVSALRPPNGVTFSKVEVRLRDAFDHLFSELDRFDIFIEAGLVRAESFKPYLIYWLDILGNPNNGRKPLSLQHAMWRFVDDWGYDGLQRLCRRYGYSIQPPVRLEPGDIFFTRGRHWIGRLIRFFTRGIGESRTKVNHVGIVVAGGLLRRLRRDVASGLVRPGEPEAVAVEALSRVRRHPLSAAYLDGRTEVAVYRPKALEASQVRDAVAWAEKEVGHPYGWPRIIGHFLDWLLFGAYVFRRLFRVARYPICSYLVAEAYEQAAPRFFGGPPDAASPDDLWDFVTALPHGPRFECVRDLA
ncbi:MAG: hypothetical protein IT304_09785, partial [Dehalococcoidia bacterium]|nr:hypothetical protein [Dehalococcoidia bacterium]